MSCCDTNGNYCDLHRWLAGDFISRRPIIRIGLNPSPSCPHWSFFPSQSWPLSQIRSSPSLSLALVPTFTRALLSRADKSGFVRTPPSPLAGCLPVDWQLIKNTSRWLFLLLRHSLSPRVTYLNTLVVVDIMKERSRYTELLRFVNRVVRDSKGL